LLAAIGLVTRVALVSSFTLGLYLLTVRNGFVGIRQHEDCVALFMLLILAAARAGDAVSIDALRRKAPPPASGEYQWPLRLMQCFLVFVLTSAGVSKLRHSGLAWPTEVFPSPLLVGDCEGITMRPLVGFAN